MGVVANFCEELGTDITNAEEADQWLHETIDGHGRVIYTFRAMQCLVFSDNDGAYVEEFGSDGLTTDGCLNWSMLAFSAFRADVMESMELYEVNVNELFDEVQETVDNAKIEATDVGLPFNQEKVRRDTFQAKTDAVLAEMHKGGWKV